MASSGHKFKTGKRIGCRVIVGVAPDRLVPSRNPFVSRAYSCRCTRCGSVSEMLEHALGMAHTAKSKTCAGCFNISDSAAHYRLTHDGQHRPGGAQKSTSKPFECETCYDLPHRRPKTKPCKCGKRYEPDTFAATDEDAHACANLWLYASRELGPDAFSGLIEWL